jgi:(R)-2-hydroxyacyl-CoA dehydratese activating ATPase
VDGVRFDRIMATGYGRNLFEISFDAPTVTEIKAHARGARAIFSEALTVLDIGGQDSKAISLSDNGRIRICAVFFQAWSKGRKNIHNNYSVD